MSRFAFAFALIGVLIVASSSSVGAQDASRGGGLIPCNHTLSNIAVPAIMAAVGSSGMASSEARWNTSGSKNVALGALIGDGSIMEFKPEKPGKYVFTFESQDLCVGKNRSAEVCVRCPPPPIVEIQRSASIVRQGGTVSFSSDGTTVNNTGTWVKNGLTYQWSISKFPAAMSAVERSTFSLSSTSQTFETPRLTVNGEYEVKLDVSDGCSVSTKITSFVVECNCGPTANAGATTTIWSNADYIASKFAMEQVNNKLNFAGLGNPFILDGSLSTDFDLIHSGPDQEKLTYEWSCISWVPAGAAPYGTLRASSSSDVPVAFNARHYPLYPNPANQFNANSPWLADASSRVAPSAVSYGYDVVMRTGTGGGPMGKSVIKEYSFQRLAMLSNSVSEFCSTESSSCGRSVVSNSSNEVLDSIVVSYPKWVSLGLSGEDSSIHHNNDQRGGENFMTFGWTDGDRPKMDWASGRTDTDHNQDPTTTSMMAWIEKTSRTSITTEVHTNISTVVTTDGAGDHTYCKIRIQQDSPDDPKAFLYILNPDFHPAPPQDASTWDTYRYPANPRPTYIRESGAFELCRGIWTFSLTVMDACGEDAKSVDEFKLTVRCNRPPVAIACCDTTVVYKSGSGGQAGEFPQVTVDGRHSSDDDNTHLTYYWSFLDNGYPKAHEEACIKQVGTPCEQNYCQKVLTGNFRTWIYIGPDSSASSQAFGNVTRRDSALGDLAGVTQYDKKCAPNVYPIVFDFSDNGRANAPCIKPGNPLPAPVPGQQRSQHCRYKSIDNTGYHVGNSAYFKPTAPGAYLVQMAVFDGCSTTLDVRTITAVCPTIDGRIDVSTRTGTFYPAGSQQPSTSVKLFSFVQYAGSNSALQYRWYYTTTPGGPRETTGIDNPVAANATFTPPGSGTFTLHLELDDKCRKYPVGTPIQVNIGCNELPGKPTVSIEPPGAASGAIQFDPVRLAFPTITVTASAVDPDRDPLTYTWGITTRAATDAQARNITTGFQLGGPPANNKLMFTPTLAMAPEARSTYMISVRSNDQCQNSVSLSTPLVFSCNDSLAVALTPTPTPGSEFDFATGQFERVTLETTTSVFPYPQQNSYNWCITTTNCASGNDPAAVAASAQRQGSISFQPSVVGRYEVSLTVSDQCTEKTVTTSIQASCPSLPTAALSLQASGQAAAGSSVEWDSFASTYKGSFPAVTLDASGSVAATGATGVTPMTYSFSTTGRPTGSALADPIARAGTAQAGVTLDIPGSYTFTLSVANAACESLQKPTVSFSANCMTIGLSMKNQQGAVVSPPGQVSFSSLWEGTAFAHIQLDATTTSYRSATSNSLEGNYNSLRYTWTVTNSPKDSMFEQSGETIPEYTPSETGWVYETRENSVREVGNSTTTTMVYSKTRRAVTTVTKTELFNHHYNKPITGFRPDKPGSYTIALNVDDGCSSTSMTATITSTCNQFTVPKPELKMADGSGFAGTLVLSGNSYRRIVMDARTTAPGMSCDTLTYQWTITSAPARSKSVLTNPNGNVVSIVPDANGEYTVSFTVSDGCNEPKTQNVSLTVSCPGDQIQMLAPTVQVMDPASTQRASGSEEIRFTNASAVGNARFGHAYFQIQGQSSTNCTVRERRWYYTGRSSCDCYTPKAAPPAPPPAASGCANTKNCVWKVKSFPCEWRKWNAQQYPVGCDAEGCELAPATGTVPDQCQARFKCRASGLYMLELTVQDGCSSKSETVPVTCKCAQELQLNLIDAQVNLKRCRTGGARAFEDMSISASYGLTAAPRSQVVSGACPTTPAPTMSPTAPATSGQCCPAAAPCTACTQCPQCNACSIVIQGGGGGAPVSPPVAPAPVPGTPTGLTPDAPTTPSTGSVPAPVSPGVLAPVPGNVPVPGALTPDRATPALGPQVTPGTPVQDPSGASFTSTGAEEDEEVSTALLLGVIIPISVIMVGSIVANIMLFGKFKAAQAAAAGGDSGIQLSTSPTSVVVGRSV